MKRVIFLMGLCALGVQVGVQNSAHADPIIQKIRLTEVEPIMVYEYVPETCSRSVPCSGSDDSSCTNTEYYECGGYQWVRRGSKPLRPLDVEAELNVVRVGKNAAADHYQLQPTQLEVDRGFSAQTLAALLFARNYRQFHNILMTVKEDSPQNLRVRLTATPVEVNMEELKSYYEKAQIVGKDRVILPQYENSSVVKLRVCVGKDKWLSSYAKLFGCQDVRADSCGEVVLSEIDLNQKTRRPWVYFFNIAAAGKVASSFVSIQY